MQETLAESLRKWTRLEEDEDLNIEHHALVLHATCAEYMKENPEDDDQHIEQDKDEDEDEETMDEDEN